MKKTASSDPVADPIEMRRSRQRGWVKKTSPPCLTRTPCTIGAQAPRQTRRQNRGTGTAKRNRAGTANPHSAIRGNNSTVQHSRPTLNHMGTSNGANAGECSPDRAAAQRKRRSRGGGAGLGDAGTHSTVETDSGGGGDPMRLRGTSRRRRRRRLITDQHCSGGRGLRNLFFGFIQTLGGLDSLVFVYW
jgi:hypothetical protein